MINITNKKLAPAAVLALLTLGPAALRANTPAACIQPPANMVGWYPGDGNANDIAGSNNGALQNGAGFAAGKVAQAFILNGVNQFVQAPHTAALAVTGSLTVDAWIYLRQYPTEFAPVVSKWRDISGNERAYALTVVPDGSVRFDVSHTRFFGGGGFLTGPNSFAGPHNAVAVSAAKVPLNTWVHVAGVFDAAGKKLTVYVNGVMDTSVTTVGSAIFANAEPLMIGAADLGSNARDFTNAMIDEVEIFNRALLTGEIQGLYQAGAAGKCKVAVSIDIKPCSFPNSVNTASNGVIPVAILGSASFNAALVDPATVQLDGLAVNSPGKSGKLQCALSDVASPADATANSCTPDGKPDMVCHVVTGPLNPVNGMVRLTGFTAGGVSFFGYDSVNVVK